MGIASQGAVATEASVQWEDSFGADPGTGRADPGTGSACCSLTSCLMDSWFPKEAQGPEECLGEGDKGVHFNTGEGAALARRSPLLWDRHLRGGGLWPSRCFFQRISA